MYRFIDYEIKQYFEWILRNQNDKKIINKEDGICEWRWTYICSVPETSAIIIARSQLKNQLNELFDFYNLPKYASLSLFDHYRFKNFNERIEFIESVLKNN